MRDGVRPMAAPGQVPGQAAPRHVRRETPEGREPAPRHGHGHLSLLPLGEALGCDGHHHVGREAPVQEGLAEAGRAGPPPSRHPPCQQACVFPIVQVALPLKTKKGTADRLGRMPLA